MRQHCPLTSALSLPNVLRRNFPTVSDGWMEECSPLTVPMVASSWATSLGMLWLGERGLHGLTVHICTTLWSRCMTGDTTLSSHKILMLKIRYIAKSCIHFLQWSKLQFQCRLSESTMVTLPRRKPPCGLDLGAMKSLWTFLQKDWWQRRAGE